MTRKVLLEQPPFIEDDLLKEWLTRTVIMINAAFDQELFMDPVGQLPPHIQDGMMVFFNQAIAPDITHAGPWIVVGGVWKPMTAA